MVGPVRCLLEKKFELREEVAGESVEYSVSLDTGQEIDFP